MTLLIACCDGFCAWAVADTAITGPSISLRNREYSAKLFSAGDNSFIGFSGDLHSGYEIISAVKGLPAGPEVVSRIAALQGASGHVDFVYAYKKDGASHLFKLSGGAYSRENNVWIGDRQAYLRFRRKTTEGEIVHAPEAVHQFVITAREPVPERLVDATRQMLVLFSELQDHSVGGWATPFFLGSTEAQPCAYAYNVTGPIANRLKTGMLIPQGPASDGSFSLSYSPIFDNNGAAVFGFSLHLDMSMSLDVSTFAI